MSYRLTPARMVVIVTVAFVALGATAASLARHYREARVTRAAALLDHGRMLVRAGEVDRGLDELRASLALNRGDPDIALVLATALLDANRLHESETYLDEAIAADPTSGPANLARARVARALGADDTDTYYQRAYFGSWGEAAIQQRVNVGFELVGYLLSRGERERARGVLTQIGADAGSDTDLQLRVALLLIDAGAPSDALPLLRGIVSRRPGDAPAWSALASAAFAVYEDDVAARAAAQALELDKDDQQAARIRRLSTAALALDPRAGRRSARERERRARVLLDRAAEAWDQCQASQGDAAVPVASAARAEAASVLAPRSKRDLELDELIDLATQVWNERKASCPEMDAEFDELGRVFDRLAAGATR